MRRISWSKGVAHFALPLAVGAMTVALIGCGSTEPVCQGTKQNVVLVVSTDSTSLANSRSLAPTVASQVVQRVAASCGRLLVGVAGSRPQSDLVLKSMTFSSKWTSVYNRAPIIRQLVANGDGFVRRNLLTPLGSASPSPAGAYLGTLVKVGDELQAQGVGPATVVVIGSGVENEPAPNGNGIVNATNAGEARSAALDAGARQFEPLLDDLSHSCVMLVGAGAGSQGSDTSILDAEGIVDQVLAADHVGFVATSSSALPPACVRDRPAHIQRTAHTVVANLSSDVLFQIGSANLQPAAAALLDQLAPTLATATAVTVRGYTDPSGGPAINDPLSRARANTVARWIETTAHVPASRLRAEGLGASDPVSALATPAAWAQDRRVVITIETR